MEVAIQYFNEGQKFLEAGILEQAIIAFRHAIKLAPETSWYHHYLGEALAKVGQLEEAISLYHRAIELKPDFSWSYHHLGDALDRQQKWDEAVVAFRKATKLNPKHFGSYYGLGESLVKLGRLDEAITAYRQARDLYPEADWIHSRLGEVLVQRRELDLQALIVSYQRIIDLNPDDVQAYYHLLDLRPENLEIWSKLGQLLLKLSRYEDAVIVYRRLCELNPQHLESYYYLGQTLAELGRLDEAIAVYQQASKLHPDSIQIYYSLVQALQQRSLLDKDAAIASCKSAITLNPDNVQAYSNLTRVEPNNVEIWLDLGEMLLSLDHWEEAILIYKKAIKIHPKEASIHYQLAKIFEKHDCFEEAITYYQMVLELEPSLISDDDSFAKASAKLRQLTKFPASEEFFLKTTNHLNDADFVQAAFTSYLKRSLGEQGIAEYLKLTNSLSRLQILESIKDSTEFQLCWQFFLSPSSLNKVYWKTGSFFAQKSLWDKAIEFYHKALTIQPDIAIAYSRLVQDFDRDAEIYDQQTLRAQFFNLILNYPTSSELYMSLGKLLAGQSRFGEAIEIYQTILLNHQLQPSALGKIYSEIGQAFFSNNQFENALHFLEKSLSYDVVRKEIYAAIGHLYSQTNVNLAIDFFNKALSLDPKNANYYIHLGHLYQQENNLDLAINCYRSAIANPPVHHHAYVSLVNCLIVQGKTEEAVVILHELVNLNMSLPYPEKIGIAKLMERVGLPERARTYLQNLEVYPPIQDTINSVEDWATASGTQGSNYKEIHPPHSVEFPCPPRTIDKDLDPRVVLPEQFESPKTFVVTVPGGRYCGWGTTTAAITSDNKLLNELATDFQDPHIHGMPAYYIEGTVAALSANTGNNYYHWLYDMLPRFGLLELGGINIDSIDKFLVSGYFLNAQKETLEILGIPSSKVIDSLNYPHIKADKLIVPSYPGIINYPTKWVVDFLRSKFLHLIQKNDSKLEYPERIHLTRRSATHRKIINEDEMLEVLQEYDFITIDPAMMSIAELAPFMANAKVVIGYGAGNANLFLCSPKTKLIELFSPYFIGPNYRMISHYLELEYYYLVGAEGIVCPYLRQLMYFTDGFVDNLVDLNSLKQLFNLAGVEPRRREL